MDDDQRIERMLQAQADAAPAARYERRFRDAARLLAALRRRGFAMHEISPFVDELERAARESDARGVRTVYGKLVEHLEKQHGLVLPDHYQNQWMALGMSAFGLPIGVAFAFAIDQTAFIGIGLPLGLAVGVAIGTRKDREAKAAGRVLELDAPEAK